MKKLFTLTLLVFYLSSCTDESTDPTVEPSPVEWEMITINTQGQVYSFYGDLNDFLLVSTSSKILRTTTLGIIWTEVLSIPDAVVNFMDMNGKLYAITNSTDYSSDDQGLTWKAEDFNWESTQPSPQLSDFKGTLYHLVWHYDGELALPSTLLRSVDHGNSWQAIFPFQKIIIATHLDQHDRFYVSTAGYTWSNERNFFTEDSGQTAHIYYTKN